MGLCGVACNNRGMSFYDAVRRHRIPQDRASALFRSVSVLAYPIRYWNWKTALIAAVIRGLVFLLALGNHGGKRSALVEIVYVVLTSGFYSAMQQGLLAVRPLWLSRMGIVAGVPTLALAVDCLAHIAAGSASPKGVTLGVLVFSLISAAFHLHVMENGVMLTGSEGASFVSDMKAVPRLLLSFVTTPLNWAASAIKPALPVAEIEAVD
jgi:hypothetical protein